MTVVIVSQWFVENKLRRGCVYCTLQYCIISLRLLCRIGTTNLSVVCLSLLCNRITGYYVKFTVNYSLKTSAEFVSNMLTKGLSLHGMATVSEQKYATVYADKRAVHVNSRLSSHAAAAALVTVGGWLCRCSVVCG